MAVWGLLIGGLLQLPLQMVDTEGLDWLVIHKNCGGSPDAGANTIIAAAMPEILHGLGCQIAGKTGDVESHEFGHFSEVCGGHHISMKEELLPVFPKHALGMRRQGSGGCQKGCLVVPGRERLNNQFDRMIKFFQHLLKGGLEASTEPSLVVFKDGYDYGCFSRPPGRWIQKPGWRCCGVRP